MKQTRKLLFIVGKIELFSLINSHLETHLVVVVQAGLDLSLRFQTAHNTLVLPANLAGDTTDLAVATIRAEAQNLHCRWNADALLFVVGRWNAFEHLQASECELSTTRLVWNHATNGLPEHTRWSTEMEWTTSWIDVAAFSQERQELDLVSGR